MVEMRLETAVKMENQGEIRKRFPPVQFVAADRLEWAEPTQAEIVVLYHYLDRLGYTVVSVTRREPDLESVFLSLTG